MTKIFCLLLLISCLQTFASFDNSTIGGSDAGLGFANVTCSDLWSLQNNQAGAASIQHFSIGTFYENRFMLKELSYKAAAIACPTKSGVFGLTTSYFGYSQYNETSLGLAYAKKLGKNISAGICFDHLSVHIAEPYGNKSVITFEVGLLAKITEKLTAGIHIFNPASARLTDYADERIPTIFRFGFSYSFSKIVILNTEYEKSLNQNPSFKAGLEYHPVKEMFMRADIMTNPVAFKLGAGVKYKKIKLDFATSVHQILGYSPAISMIYEF